ncbi:zinc ABC transporter substrate-binding protein [Rouxiella badensis]|jgi:zinc/manganese transport system substrate-binding protein|uniref:metal ABC transporter solute-binding protein, Zn/Mn family n=1 Tax=Rouxiella badensis TaxID=1646377 RepID=UPI00198099AE|nr:zinc ABC transporter substrate-binding protein [Rouxiella badensis]MCC3701753.1 zinc ABC transporter substrate-binding protein [Rouxiella badensis]MCC3720059.1 zinc ABC transporter substrate-binding protein [Rouxiella badensis]MCC3729722.1 zinc ABC transporter substrate-binding protein [Rouxiella badensis]MCC3731395.1 zinc ABC transporter substrate-binding protein [Rouxiella badensis]MCC3738330.1 zinc ABC transporter substrate-binding protein [Rouxiella badensis]
MKGKLLVLAGVVAQATVLGALSAGQAAAAITPVLHAIGVENQYADVISQIGGKFVEVEAIETDPNTDPHTFEASPKIAAEIAHADLVVMNGLGYDAWTDKFLAAAPNASRKVINVQQLMNLPDKTSNPHLWYKPEVMPAVAKQIAADLSAAMPDQKAYFNANAGKFTASLAPWHAALDKLKSAYSNSEVAVTEPVGDYLLQAAGLKIATPFNLEAAIMNGTDPAPQDVTAQNALFADGRLKVFVYNQQVTDPLTETFLSQAKTHHIPVVGVYETMPTPGYHYQSWMLAETNALIKALTDQTSTESLLARH